MNGFTFAQACQFMRDTGFPVRQKCNPGDIFFFKKPVEGSAEGTFFVAVCSDMSDPQIWFPTEDQVKATDYGVAL